MRTLGIVVLGAAITIIHLTTVAWASDYYKVDVTRKAQDLYEVDGQGIYIKTRYCYEYVYSSEAIVQVDSPAGYTVGEIIFTGNGGSKCDIEKLLR
jgi:hypothetical protein